MQSLVDVAWLQAHLNDADLRVLDCTVAFDVVEGGRLTFHSGRENWAKAHIPGSAFADIPGELSDTASPYQFTLPDAASFGAAMGRLGVGKGTRVVLYDTTYTMWATRVWWMLNAFGFHDAAVLDGGFTAWRAAGAPVSDDAPVVTPAEFDAYLDDGWFADKDVVHAAVAAGDTACIVDALMPDMYTGAQQPYERPGHLPGAINVPAVGIVDPDTRLFLDDTELRQRFAPALDDPDRPVITYCGGGIAATADAFVLRRLGKKNVAVYDGSMAQWTADPAMPLVLGDKPR